MAFDVAANFGATMRQVAPIAGFENVKSDLAAQTLMRVPFENAAMQLSLADSAIKAKLAMDQVREQNKFQKSLFDKRLESERRQTKFDTLRMAGAGLVNAFSGIGQTAAAADIDPMSSMEQYRRFLDMQRQRQERDASRISQGAVAGVQLLGS